MALADLFRPKWKHSDVSVRTNAVKAMDPSDVATLMQIARDDPDEAVRTLAIRKIEDPELLAELAEGDLEDPLRELAQERMSSHWVTMTLEEPDLDAALEALDKVTDEAALAEVAIKAEHSEVRRAALERVSDPKALAEIAREAKEADLRLVAVEGIDDPATLRGLTLGSASRQVALAALDKLDDPEDLDTVAKQAKHKALRSRAQRKIRGQQKVEEKPAHQGPSAEELERHRKAQLLLLLQEVESLSPNAGDPEAAAKLEQGRRRFDELLADSGEDHREVRERFERACASFQAELEAYTRRLDEEKQRREMLEVDRAARESLCRKVETLSETAEESDLSEIETAWSALGEVSPELAAVERRFTKAVERFRERRRDWQARREARQEFEELVEQAEKAGGLDTLDLIRKELGPLRRKWGGLARKYGVDEDLKARWDQVNDAVRQRESDQKAAKKQEREDNKVRLDGILQQLRDVRESDDWRAAARVLGEARKSFKKPGPLPSKQTWNELRSQFRELESALNATIEQGREADGWNRHFADSKLEELCARAEELCALEDRKEAAKALRALQAEWKKAGPGTRERNDELWGRFKKACDEAYARCEGHFAQMREQRAENLAKKQAICEEAEALAESVEWRETAERLKQLQAEWKAIGPVDRKHSDAIWKRFRAACDQFFGHRKEHFKQLDAEREENLKIKKALCEKAEALAESDDWYETTEELKALQAEWKAIGPVPRKHSDAVWKRFRGACDHFFARRDAHLDDGRRTNLQRKVELLDGLEALVKAPDEERDPAVIAEKLQEAWREWPKIEPVPFDQVQPLKARLDELCREAIERASGELSGTEFDPELTLRRRQKIVEQLDKLLSKPAESKDAPEAIAATDSGQDVAQLLQRAMEANVFRKESRTEEKQRTEERAEKLWASWKKIPPTPGEATAELEGRFQKTFKKLTGRAPGEEPQDAPRSGPKRKGRGRGRGAKPPARGASDTRPSAPPPADEPE